MSENSKAGAAWYDDAEESANDSMNALIRTVMEVYDAEMDKLWEELKRKWEEEEKEKDP